MILSGKKSQAHQFFSSKLSRLITNRGFLFKHITCIQRATFANQNAYQASTWSKQFMLCPTSICRVSSVCHVTVNYFEKKNATDVRRSFFMIHIDVPRHFFYWILILLQTLKPYYHIYLLTRLTRQLNYNICCLKIQTEKYPICILVHNIF